VEKRFGSCGENTKSDKMSEIEVREIKKEEYKIWNELVDISPHGTIFHKLDWLKIVEKHTNSKLYLFVGCIGEEIIAAIPFFYYKNHLFKMLFSPIGSTMIQNLGPIIPNYDKLKQNKREFYFREFQKALDKFICLKINPHVISITTSPNLIDVRPYAWNNYQITPKYNYIKNIENLNSVWTGFKKSLRKNIVNTEKAGIKIEEGDLDSYKFILQSLSIRLKEQGKKLSVSKEYMLDLYNRFNPNNLKVFISKYKEKTISGITFITYEDKITIWMGATRAPIKGLYPVDLLQWKIIEWGNENGFKRCEILGANIPSISYFKSKYNFNLDIYFHIEKKTSLIKISKKIYNIIKVYKYFIP